MRGRLLWLGALASTSHLWASVALQVGSDQFFLGDVGFVGLSVSTVIGGLATTGPDRVATAIGVEAFALGVPETPLLIVEFARTPDGGVEFAMGSGVFAVGAILGLCYAYVRSRHERQ